MSSRSRAWLRSDRRRRMVQAVADGSVMLAAIVVAALLRFEFSLGPETLSNTVVFGGVAAVVLVTVGYARGLYSGRHSFGSFEEFRGLMETVFIATGVLLVVDLLVNRLVPLSVPLIAGTFALSAGSGARYAWRRWREKHLRPNHENVERLVVIGAGEAGRQIVTAMLRSPNGRYLPVAVLDDDPVLANLEIRGVGVGGTRADLASVAEETGASVALLAIPSAGSAVIREVEAAAAKSGLRLLVLPSVSELYGAEVGVSDIRPVTPNDLLGRHENDTDVASIAGYITGRRVLVTGAGGSIGSELCRQLYRFAPESLVMLERDESALHAVQLSIEGRAMLDSRNLVVADIRDGRRVRDVFDEHRPEVVFHAAALKHLPLLEMHPAEALKTNVWGTAELLDAAAAVGVERFVNISTDKAANPTSVLGYTKRIAERITADMASCSDGTYLSVRFGNVLGSRGSVLTAFRSQIAAGGPVTVTDPEVTRYFMTVEEAVQLVIQAGAVGRDGEALVLEMGKPVAIAEVARRLIAEADRPIDIVYTGLRNGEKLHEELFGDHEVDERPCHPGISHVAVPPIDRDLIPTVEALEVDLTQLLARCCDLPTTTAQAGGDPHRGRVSR